MPVKEIPPVVLEALDAQGQGLRVEFQKQGDRFTHKLFAVSGKPVSGKEVQLLLESVEGPPGEAAPPSPPFTELHQQQDTLFLTGATTLGHWSMSVQALDNRLLFDVACRAKSTPNNLGSTYRVLSNGTQLESKNATVTHPAKHTQRITPHHSPKPSPTPTTLQWQYTLAPK